jgi:hypothetical protein
MEILATPVKQIAEEVARALVRVSSREEAVRLSLPLLYPGGTRVGIEISRLRDAFLVSDAGGARMEAGLLGGERAFQRIAHDVADRFAIRFDHNMMFDLDVSESELVVAVVAVANAAKTAVENTAIHLASVEHADYRAHLWDRLEAAYGLSSITRKPRSFRGAAEQWEFDAAVERGGALALFEVVTPNANSVNSAVTKFLDVRDLGETAPRRIAVLTKIGTTPRLPVLGRTARLLTVDASVDEYRAAA